MQYKYKLPIYQIDEDGDLKFLFFLNTEYLPRINENICYFKCDENGKPVYREYYDVKNILYPVIDSDNEDNVKNTDFAGEIVLHVELTVSEPVLNL